MLLLSKITSLVLYPLSFSLFLLLLAFLLRLRGARARSASLTLIGALWLYVCSTEFGASALSRPLESAYPAFANEELPAAQAIVILGGATAESRYGLAFRFEDPSLAPAQLAELFRFRDGKVCEIRPYYFDPKPIVDAWAHYSAA